jgi:hypothetical protein
MKRILILIASVIMIGCATTNPYDKMHLEAAIKSVEARTAFDMDCEEVSSNLLGDITYITGTEIATMNIGVTGCNKKVIYYTECAYNAPKSKCTPRLNTISEIRKSNEDNEAEKSN